MIKVLILDRVLAQREQLSQLLAAQHNMKVVGAASSCDEAVTMISRLQPNIALVSHQPPQLDALQVTRCIMESSPLPIIIISASGKPTEDASTLAAINAGALAVVPRPHSGPALLLSGAEREGRDLWQTIKVMAEVKVVRRWPKNSSTVKLTSAPATTQTIKIVAIGASTGGPLALMTLLRALPKNFFAPIVVVQHMSFGFMNGLIDWLASSLALPVHIAAPDVHMLPGHVYLAPDGFHLRVTHNQRIKLVDAPPDNGIRPSVGQLFQSVAEVYGQNAAAILLTGMGRDGAAELLELRQKGALTFAQDKESSVVHGMPGEAIKLEAALHIMPPEKIAAVLLSLSNAEQAGRSG